MFINFIGYYQQFDGYGRFSTNLVKALQREGAWVKPATQDHVYMPTWMLHQEGVNWANPTISCLPPYLVRKVPGEHWLYTMTEGSELKRDWVEAVNQSGVSKVLVPCEHNAEVFRKSGVLAPVQVLAAGTDPEEFSLLERTEKRTSPCTFLTFADRGFRKGWEEVYEAFYKAFGGKTSGDQDVRLIIKSLPRDVPTVVAMMDKATDKDKRIQHRIANIENMRELYSEIDCLVLPSHCEGWGMIHREVAMMGLPVITQAYAGLDDGHTDEWAYVVNEGRMESISKKALSVAGEWRVVDTDALARMMSFCRESPSSADEKGKRAAEWLRKNQTWAHTARNLIAILEEDYYASRLGCATV